MRLAGQEKQGFYPTPIEVIEMIETYISNPEGNKGRLLDPCVGTGEPAQMIGSSLMLETFGVEINTIRYFKSMERIDHVLNTDFKHLYSEYEAFSLIFLNPPYDTGDERRLEFEFLRRSLSYLQIGGILIYIIPQHRISRHVAKLLSGHFDNVQIYKFPGSLYTDFSQVVIFGKKRPMPIQDKVMAENILMASTHILSDLSHKEEPFYFVPKQITEGEIRFESGEIDPKKLIEEADNFGLLKDPKFYDYFRPKDSGTVRPLLPLKRGHIALMIASGYLNNQVLEKDGLKLIIKGKVFKDEKVISEDTTATEKKVQTIKKTIEEIKTSINAFNLNSGEYINLK